MSTVQLQVCGLDDPLLAAAVRLLQQGWRQRTTVPLQQEGVDDWGLLVGSVEHEVVRRAVLAARMSLPHRPHSFVLASRGRRVTLCGADAHGVLYGVGHLLRQLIFQPQQVAMPKLRFTTAPAVMSRGVYFATHFNNYYESAPLPRIERYIEELALWGVDLLTFWLDTNWFPHGFWADPDSRGMAMASRLRFIRDKARACGMRVGAMAVANEGFDRQPPPRLLAHPEARHGGFYPSSQICPSQPGGLEMILDNRRIVMDLLGPLDVFVLWPYDPGGCGCPRCVHASGRWGRKFLDIGPQIAAVAGRASPGTRVFVSTWYMDDAERRMVYQQCDAGADWFQGVMTQTEHVREHALPLRYERLTFPEISMFDCYFTSYGCNGANPAPGRMARQARDVAAAGSGTTLYSEGLYEDVNKAVWAGLLWDPNREVDDILAEYGRWYFGAEQAGATVNLLHGLEQTWGAKRLQQAPPEEVRRLEREARRLGAAVKHRDGRERWRALYDRARIDLAMKQIGRGDALVRESRELFEGADYLPIADLRRRVKSLLQALRQRRRQVDRLFRLHCQYLRFFRMERTNLAFLPDAMLGKHEWDKLIGPLAAAGAAKTAEQFRTQVSRAFRRWQWFNGVGFDYLFF
jgi:hypothetical protein